MASKKAPKPRKQAIHVVFDTSAIFTKEAHYLLAKDVEKLIDSCRQHRDVELVWHLPEVVVDERTAQMQRIAAEHLPAIGRLERLLGNKLNITREGLHERIDAAIRRSVREYGLTISRLDAEAVNWPQLIRRAVYREPPFSDAPKTEKGFRDAIVLETFLQIANSKPRSPGSCHIALVAGDELLRVAAGTATTEARNVRVLASVDELKGLINTLVAKVDEEFVAKIRKQAGIFFFQRDDDSCLLRQAKILEKAKRHHDDELTAVPDDADFRKNVEWRVAPPRFVGKQKQRVTWASRIEVLAEVYRASPSEKDLAEALRLLKDAPAESVFKLTNVSLEGATRSTEMNPPKGFVPLGDPGTLIATGTTQFDAIWSVSVSVGRHLLSKGRFERFGEATTTWDKLPF